MKKNLTNDGASGGYILGLDLGVGSIGWAALFGDQLSDATLRMGVRVFEAGTQGNHEEGKDESRNLKRRTKRQTRKGVKRTRRRIVKIFNILKKAGLLPEGATSTPEARQTFLARLDQELFAAYCPNAARVEKQTFLYALRARALDEKLTLCAVGRSILHLAVRRGFLSNKKITGAKSEKEKKEDGKVKTAISELDAETAAVGARTVGEYFAKLDPMKVGERRIRGRYLGRSQIQAEFDAIWASQARFHPETLTAELRAAVWSAIFRQRPLKSQKGLIGRCEFEKTARRVEKGDPAFQEYRIWQRVLDLRLYDSPEAPETARPLTPEEQDKIAALLDENESATFNQLRKTLGIKGKPDKDDKKATLWRFNFEVDGESKLLGNRTRAKIVAVLKEQKVAKNDAEINAIAREILRFENAEALARRLRKMFPDFDEATAEKLSEVSLETTRANVSRRAAEKLTAAMKEKRLPLQTVRQELYPNERNQTVYDFLPPVFDALGDPRNPVVLRALTELRAVVNEAIRRWGKPALIRVELARDLKRGRKEREKIFNENKKRQAEREQAQEEIKAFYRQNGRPAQEPKPFEILKWRLWKECDGVCPYTGKPIPPELLLSAESPIDVEHIIPLSRSLDDSFANKTLCWAEENREVKRNQTPFECYSDKPQWREILDRVRRFKSDMRQEKLKRFLQEKIDDDPSKRMLNDTRYISRLATKYLGALYGTVDGYEPSATDEKGTRRIQVSTGGATAWLREEWGLDQILAKKGERPKKNRDDLRHHAVDALVVALVGPKEVQTLSKAAQAASERKFQKAENKAESAASERDSKRYFEKSKIAPPSTATGEAFLDVVFRAVNRITVSHRVDRKLSGSLHDETNYGAEASEGRRKIRKPLTEFKSAAQIDAIVDPEIRRLVREKWEENGGDAKKFASNPPFMEARDGRLIPIKKARYWKTNTTVAVGRFKLEKQVGRALDEKNEEDRKLLRRLRYVETANNSHMEVYAVLDENGVEQEWRSKVVSTFEAYERKRQKKPVVQRDFGPGTRFLFSLALNEVVAAKDGELLVVSGISQGVELECKRINDGRSATRRKAEKTRVRFTSATGNFMPDGLRKMRIDVLGNVFPANE